MQDCSRLVSNSSKCLPGLHTQDLVASKITEKMRRFLVARSLGWDDPHPGDSRWIVPFSMAHDPSHDPGNAEAQESIRVLLKRHKIPVLSSRRYLKNGLGDMEYVRDEAQSQGIDLPPESNRVAIHGSCSLLEYKHVTFTSKTDYRQLVAFWMVTDDQGVTTIEGEDIDGYDYEEIEVASRVL